MKEIWKDIVFTDLDGTFYDYTGMYQVSNIGRVRSLDRVINGRLFKGEIRLPKINERGYYRHNFTKDGKRKYFFTHRLVAFMFIGQPNIPLEEFPTVNHIDEIKENNRVENLIWCTQKENNNHGSRNQRVKEKLKGRTFSEETLKRMSEGQKKSIKKQHKRGADHQFARPVIGVNLQSGEAIRFDCILQADSYFNKKGACSAISNQLRGKCKTSYGYKWCYKEDYQE